MEGSLSAALTLKSSGVDISDRGMLDFDLEGEREASNGDGGGGNGFCGLVKD